MKEATWRKVLLAAIVAGMLTGLSPLSVGQDAKEKKAKGRLPAYYADIVTEQQRATIYAIQAKYEQQLDALNAQVTALEKQRNLEVENVLTPAQKEQLKKARDEAADKRKKKSDEKKAADEADKAAPADAKAPPADAKKAANAKKTK
jgi:hypothetical protein